MLAKFEKGNSVLHRLNPLAKLWVLAAYSISIFLCQNIFIGLACLVVIVIIARAIRSRSTLSLLASKFALALAVWLIVMQVIFTPAGHVLASIPVCIATITVTDMGLANGLVIALRFLTIIAASMLFVSTTDPAELAFALMKAGLPYRYGFMLITALRFMPIFEIEMGTVANAQKARGLEIDGGGVRSLIKSINYTLLPLITSALTKVDVQVLSMEGRAFGYRRTRTFTHSSQFTKADVAIVAVSSAITTFLIIDSLSGRVSLPA